MKSFFNKQLVSRLFTLAVLVAFVWYGFSNPESFEALASVSVASLVLVGFGRLLIYVGNGFFIKWTTEAFTGKLSTGEGLYVGMLSAIGNFFGPLLGGASIRAVYLKKIHNLSYSKFTSTLMGYYLILFTVNCAFAIAGLLLIAKTQQTNALLAFFSIWLAVLILLMFARLPKRTRFKKMESRKLGKRIVNILFEIEEGWRILLKKSNLFIKLAGLAALSFSAHYLISYVEFRAIGADISLAALGLYAAILAISLLVSFTPGAIGIREAMLLVVAGTLGVTNEQILQVAIIDRGVNFLLLFLLFLLTRSKRVKKTLTSRELPV